MEELICERCGLRRKNFCGIFWMKWIGRHDGMMKRFPVAVPQMCFVGGLTYIGVKSSLLLSVLG
jgi:hypothetical protein